MQLPQNLHSFFTLAKNRAGQHVHCMTVNKADWKFPDISFLITCNNNRFTKIWIPPQNSIQSLKYGNTHNPKKFNSIQLNSIQFNSIQLNSIQFNSIQLNSTQFNSISDGVSRLQISWSSCDQRSTITKHPNKTKPPYK